MRIPFVTIWVTYITSILASKTIIDVLSSEARFSDMIYLLQESRMIPIINRLYAGTLLVLTNDALAELDKKYPSHEDKQRLVRYHLLAGNLTISDLRGSLIDYPLLETWLGKNDSLGVPNPLGPERGQRIRVHASSVPFRKTLCIGNAEIIEGDIKADNGIIHIVDKYLIPPKNVLEVAQTYPELKRFVRLLNSTPSLLQEALNPYPHSFFVWSDQSLETQFNPVELKYLESESFSVSSLDRYLLLGTTFLNFTILNSTTDSPPVFYIQNLLPGDAVKSINLAGDPVTIERPLSAKRTLLYNDIETQVTDILTSNGVIHVLKEAVKPSQLHFNPIKYIVGLGSERFAATLNNTQMRDVLLKPQQNYTVLVPPDDSFEIISSTNSDSAASLELIQYHMIEGKYSIDDFSKVNMVSTLLNGEFLGNQSQRIKVSPGISEGQILFNSKATLVKGGVVLGDIAFQKVSTHLNPPLDIINTISHDSELSTFYQLLQVSGLEAEVKSVHGLTGFIPTDDAFQPDSQKLLLKFLLKESSISVLQAFIRYCLINQLVFSTEINPNNTISEFPTLLKGQKIQLIPNQNELGQPILSASRNFKNLWDVVPKVISTDQFIRTGVIHKTSALLAPRSQYSHLTARNYIKGVDADTFLMLLNRANLTHLLDGPCRSVKGNCDSPDQAYSVLVPTEKAWSGINITKLQEDPVLLARTLKFHFLTQRLPGRLDHLSRSLSVSTLSPDLPRLKVVLYSSNPSQIDSFKTNSLLTNIKLRLSGAPLAMFTWEAHVPMAGQAYDLSIVLVDNIMFISELPSTWTSILTSFLGITIFIICVCGIGYAGYRGYFQYPYAKLCETLPVIRDTIIKYSQIAYHHIYAILATSLSAFIKFSRSLYNRAQGYSDIAEE